MLAASSFGRPRKTKNPGYLIRNVGGAHRFGLSRGARRCFTSDEPKSVCNKIAATGRKSRVTPYRLRGTVAFRLRYSRCQIPPRLPAMEGGSARPAAERVACWHSTNVPATFMRCSTSADQQIDANACSSGTAPKAAMRSRFHGIQIRYYSHQSRAACMRTTVDRNRSRINPLLKPPNIRDR